MRIAVLEDSLPDAALAVQVLVDAGHEVTHYQIGQNLLDNLLIKKYDLLLLDWILPDMTGYDVLNWVRKNIGAHIIVLFLSNRTMEENVVLGLMAGGDDYLRKPLRRAELLARIHVLSRRLNLAALDSPVNGIDSNVTLKIAGYHFNLVTKIATLHNQIIDLNPKEFDIAVTLFQKYGQIVSRKYLMDHVWGHELLMTSRTLDTHISRTRKKLRLTAENGIHMTTIYNSGYRLDLIDQEGYVPF